MKLKNRTYHCFPMFLNAQIINGGKVALRKEIKMLREDAGVLRFYSGTGLPFPVFCSPHVMVFRL